MIPDESNRFLSILNIFPCGRIISKLFRH